MVSGVGSESEDEDGWPRDLVSDYIRGGDWGGFMGTGIKCGGMYSEMDGKIGAVSSWMIVLMLEDGLSML